MTPGYNVCSQESGTGAFARMKGHMATHVELEKQEMFDSASQLLLHQLLNLQVSCQVSTVELELVTVLL